MSLTAKVENLSASINEAITALATETDAAKQDATFRAWLTTMSRFHSYSFGNQMLIMLQCPTATQVAGFNKWKTMGRFVKKGETGIRIQAPLLRKNKTEGDTSQTEEATGKYIAGFRTVSVFDLAQTDGEPLPELNHDATEGGEELLPQLETAIRAFGINLVYKAISTGAQGYSIGGTIEIEQDQTVPAKCGTLAHELAHELLHKEDRSQGKQQRELEAEAVAFAVLTHYGIRSESRFYLATYDITGEMLTASMKIIATTARKIIEKIEGIEDEGAEAEPSALPLAA